MKKSYLAVIMTLLVVLCVSFGGTYLVLNWNDIFKTYSEGYCLNEKVTDDMSRIDIARLYTDSCITVVLNVTPPSGSGYTVLGSGVCIASNGYEVNGDYPASKGSYFATNYHVVSYACDPLYDGYSTEIEIELNSSDTRYSASLLWANQDLDVAVIYCDEVSDIGWINMKDRVIACDTEDKINYDEIFVVGTPHQIQYKNTLTLGNISNNSTSLVEVTGTTIYTYTDNGEVKCTADERKGTKQEVCENIYENVIMINCDITNGNSGGGVFDKYGNLIGLATLGRGEESYAMNFFVPIYPITLVLDKIILANETNVEQDIYTLEQMKIAGIDANEVDCVTKVRIIHEGRFGYYLDGIFYSQTSYRAAFSFSGDGVCILTNKGSYSSIPIDFVITSVKRNDLDPIEIKDRNDLLFFLLSCNRGDKINIYGKTLTGSERSFTITL